LWRRQAAAQQIIQPFKAVRFSDSVAGQGQKFFELAKKQDLEGIMAKDKFSTYYPGRRSPSWLKIKNHLSQEVVIGGWTEPRGSRQHIGALVLGVFDEGNLRYVGHTAGG
jgi:bifunctional non-homologous end joining protein LigD